MSDIIKMSATKIKWTEKSAGSDRRGTRSRQSGCTKEDVLMPETKIKWDEDKVMQVVQEARTAGRIAAEEKLAALQAAGPAFTVHNADIAGNKGPAIGTLLDVCGWASLRIRARGKFYLLAKEISGRGGHRFYCRRDDYYGGGMLSIYDSSMRQEMSVNVAACQAHAYVLAKYGIEATVTSRID